MNQSSSGGWKIWGEAARPKTLPAAIAPVLVASALARHDGGFEPYAALTCLVFALLIQIGTNYANDYYDFVKGADTIDRIGPRRAVAAGLISPPQMRFAMVVVFAIAFAVGLSLLRFGGWPLLVIGVTSIGCGVLYTGGPYPLAYHGWGDVFVFIFFGLVAVTATYFVQVGMVSWDAWLLGAGIGALSTNILVINNYRDIDTDRKAGKRTLVVRLGRTYAQMQFAGGHLIMIAVVTVLNGREVLGPMVSVGLILFFATNGFVQVRRLRQGKSASALIELLGATGRHVAISAVLLAIGLNV